MMMLKPRASKTQSWNYNKTIQKLTEGKPSGKLSFESKLQMKKERQFKITLGTCSVRVISPCWLHLVLPILSKKNHTSQKNNQPPTSLKTPLEMP